MYCSAKSELIYWVREHAGVKTVSCFLSNGFHVFGHVLHRFAQSAECLFCSWFCFFKFELSVSSGQRFALRHKFSRGKQHDKEL